MDGVYNSQTFVIFHVHGLVPCPSIVLVVRVTFDIGLHLAVDGPTDGHVIAKISRIYRLPFFRTHSSPLALL